MNNGKNSGIYCNNRIDQDQKTGLKNNKKARKNIHESQNIEIHVTVLLTLILWTASKHLVTMF